MKCTFDQGYLYALYSCDPDVETHFVRYFSDALKAPLSRRLRRPQVIEDVTQETLYRALRYFRAGKNLREASSLPAFVASISNNVSRELFRSESSLTAFPDGYEDTRDVHSDPELTTIAGEK